jgi:hypothetical protein
MSSGKKDSFEIVKPWSSFPSTTLLASRIATLCRITVLLAPKVDVIVSGLLMSTKFRDSSPGSSKTLSWSRSGL